MPNNLSRRQLLKAVGVAGAGVTLAKVDGISNKVFANDSSANAIPRKYWWVKDVSKPTIEIDWGQMQRFKEWQTSRGSLAEYRGEEEHARYNKMQTDNLSNWEKESKPGYKTRDIALRAAVGFGRPDFAFMGPQRASTPEDRGVPKYEGTPEENAKIVTAALRHMGAATVGFCELETDTTRKLIYDEEPAPKGTRIVFENIDVGYEEENKLVIPEKARYVITFTVQMSPELMKFGPTALGSMTTGLAYTKMWTIYSQLHEFLRALGYHSYGASRFNGFGIYPAFAVMSGLGEMSRLNRMITPEYGPNVRAVSLTTDLPLAPTKPIDFGVMNFCRDCMTCAISCPSGALSKEKEPTWEPKGPWSNAGKKAYYEDSVKCRNYWSECGTNCGVCFATCPYAADDDASIHNIVKGTISATSAFNSLLVSADKKAFPFESKQPMKDPDTFWNNVNLAEQGIDTRKGGRNI